MLLNPERATPFTMGEGRIGCVLVHGFTGSPWEMRHLGEGLVAQGFRVAAPLLPGHGTSDSDLNKVSFRDWVDVVDEAYGTLASQCDQVFAAGLSMGGVLSLHLAAHRPLAGVAAFAAFLQPADWRAPLVDVIKYVKAYERKYSIDIKDPVARAGWCGYDRYPTWGASEMMRLCRHLADDLGDVRCPTLLMHAPNDHSVKFDQMALVDRGLGSKDKKLITLSDSWHIVTVDNDKDLISRETAGFFLERSSPSRSTATA